MNDMQTVSNPLDLRRLRYFVEVAQQLHFGRAAARLGIAQPPLSQQIRQLEESLGVRLFERTSRHVALTPAGEALLTDARRILHQVREAEDAVQRIARGVAGTLRLGFVGSAIDSILPGIVRRFREDVQGSRLALQELTTAQQAAGLRDHTLDVGFIRPPVFSDGLTVSEVYREPLIVALPAGHRLAERDMLELSTLSREPFVIFRRDLGEGLHDLMVNACRHAGFEPVVGQEANQMHTIVGLVSAGLGIALVPQSVSQLRPGAVAYRPLSDTRIETTLAVANRADDDSVLVARFMDVVTRDA